MSANVLLVNVQVTHPGDAKSIRAAAALERVKQFPIVDAASYQSGAAYLAEIKGQYAEVEAERVDLKAPILEAGRKVDALYAAPLRFLKESEGIMKGKLTTYDEQQKEIARKEQARLDDLARKERERREAEAREAQRKADEKAANERRAAEEKRRTEEIERRKIQEAENARLKAERDAAEARARGDREAREKAEREAQEARERATAAEKAANEAKAAATKLETRAAQTQERGAEKAEFLNQQAAAVVAPTVQVDVPKVAGLSTRKAYKAKVIDLMALVKAIAEGKAPVAYVLANEQVLNKMAAALKEQMSIPGVELEEDTIKSSKAVR